MPTLFIFTVSAPVKGFLFIFIHMIDCKINAIETVPSVKKKLIGLLNGLIERKPTEDIRDEVITEILKK